MRELSPRMKSFRQFMMIVGLNLVIEHGEQKAWVDYEAQMGFRVLTYD